MKTLLRYAGIVFTAFVLAVGLGMGTDSPYGSVAEAQLGTSWDISLTDTSMQFGGAAGDSQSISSDSEQSSSDGQSCSDHQAATKNADGTGSEEEDFDYDDGKCIKGGGFSRHTTIDKNGNRRVHYQEIWRENGKCEIVITDAMYDKNRNPIGEPEIKRYPCAEYKLEMRFQGSANIPGMTHAEWGPHKAVIPLTEEDGTYKGSYEGQFHATMVGECNGYANYPVSVEVTAVEDEFEDLDFTIKLTIAIQSAGRCEDVSSSSSTPPMTGTKTFTLPAKDGASYVIGTPGGELTYTFTLRKQCWAAK